MSERPEIFQELIHAIRERARLRSEDAAMSPTRLSNVYDAELFEALARLIEGKSVYEAFGAPGNWGYDTAIGKALKAVYARPGSNPTRATCN